tara:strand:+ start:3215 stop:4141 length:927 start_codon:yes stop_codon:yes gene_type:complete
MAKRPLGQQPIRYASAGASQVAEVLKNLSQRRKTFAPSARRQVQSLKPMTASEILREYKAEKELQNIVEVEAQADTLGVSTEDINREKKIAQQLEMDKAKLKQTQSIQANELLDTQIETAEKEALKQRDRREKVAFTNVSQDDPTKFLSAEDVYTTDFLIGKQPKNKLKIQESSDLPFIFNQDLMPNQYGEENSEFFVTQKLVEELLSKGNFKRANLDPTQYFDESMIQEIDGRFFLKHSDTENYSKSAQNIVYDYLKSSQGSGLAKFYNVEIDDLLENQLEKISQGLKKGEVQIVTPDGKVIKYRNE